MNTAPFITRVFSAQTVDETTHPPIDGGQHEYLTFVLEGSASGTISSGVVTIEQAFWDKQSQQAYAGTWSTLYAFTAADVNGGLQKAYQLPVAAYGFLRARISTVIGGGGSVSGYWAGH